MWTKISSIYDQCLTGHEETAQRKYLCMQERLAITIDAWCFRRHALEVRGSRSLNTLGIISWQKQHQQCINSPNILGRHTVLQLPTWISHQHISKSSKATLAMYNCAYQGFYRSVHKLLSTCPMPASPRIPNLLVITGTALPHSKQGILQWLLPRWPEYHSTIWCWATKHGKMWSAWGMEKWEVWKMKSWQSTYTVSIELDPFCSWLRGGDSHFMG